MIIKIREKVGGKICDYCKDQILQTQWRYTIDIMLTKYDPINTIRYDDKTHIKYVHENCYLNYIKEKNETF
jgi:hypothetical protein